MQNNQLDAYIILHIAEHPVYLNPLYILSPGFIFHSFLHPPLIRLTRLFSSFLSFVFYLHFYRSLSFLAIFLLYHFSPVLSVFFTHFHPFLVFLPSYFIFLYPSAPYFFPFSVCPHPSFFQRAFNLAFYPLSSILFLSNFLLDSASSIGARRTLSHSLCW